MSMSSWVFEYRKTFLGGFKLSTEIDACKWLSCEVVGERDESGDLD